VERAVAIQVARSADRFLKTPSMGELRAFVVVADELHFARAASRLGIAPPSLSQAIRRLEEKLGAVLFVRTPRSVGLTGAGEELLPRARDILRRLDEAQAAVNAEARAAPGSLTIGISSNGFAELTAPIMSAFRRAHPDVRVFLRDVTQHPSPVVSGAVDVALVRPPVQEQWDVRIRFTEVVDEPRVALLPAGHRLADAHAISIADLSEESFVEVGPGKPQITDYWAATEELGGERPRMGGGADTVAGVLHAVAYLGDVITSIPSVLRFFHVPGIVAVPIVDVPPATMAICTRADDLRPLTSDFADTVSRVASRAIDLVPGGRVLPSPRPEVAAL
jgi:DNA-binding transcriptional LysR family regulator